MTINTAKEELLTSDERCFFDTNFQYTKTEHGVGNYTSENPVNNSTNDESLTKCDRSFVYGLRQLVLCAFTLDKPSSHKLIEKPRINFFKEESNLF